MLDKEFYKLKDIAYIFKGYSTTKLKGNIENAINNRDKSNSNFDDFLNKEEVKILGWKQIKEYVKNHKVDDNCNVIEISRKYNKNINYMQKGDIIFPVILQKGDEIDVIYIDEEPEEKCIYNETVLVVRVTKANIDSKYIYIMCKESKSIQKGLLQLASSNSVIQRITKELISMILITSSTDAERKKIVEKYESLQLAEEKFREKINEVQTQLGDKSSVIWFKK